MTMLNWNDYRNQILARVGEIGKLSPDTVKGYVTLGGAGAKTGHLDAKTRELIALANTRSSGELAGMSVLRSVMAPCSQITARQLKLTSHD